MKPLIGVSLDVREFNTRRYNCIDLTYIKAIAAAGGVPLLIPPGQIENIPELLEGLSGIMLTGGDDYDPAFYGQEKSPQTLVGAPERQEFDLDLARYVLNQTSLPVLGICAGCQITNIALGGTLHQDIPETFPESKVPHGNDNGNFSSHTVSLSSTSKLKEIYGADTVSTPAWHHQSVKTPGEGLSIVSWAEDGVVEALELDGERFVIGVQWHPEQDLKTHLCLFEAFVKAAECTMSGVSKKELICLA